MIINIQYVGVPFSESLTDSAITKLEELSDKYEMVTKATILITHRNSAASEGAFCEIKLDLLNSAVLAATSAGSFKMAIIETIRKLEERLWKKSLSAKAFSRHNSLRLKCDGRYSEALEKRN